MDKKWWTLLAVCLGTFMLLLDVTIVNVALPAIQTSLHANFSDLQWVVDAYALTLASLLLTTGALADLYGRRVLFTIGLVVFTIGSLFCGAAQSPLWIILARSGQGIGGAIMFATSLALLASAFQGRERGTAFGVWGGVTGVAVAIGPVLGGVLTSGLSWRWIFYVNVPIGVFAVGVTLWRISESREATAHRPDYPGFVTFTAALVALVYALIRADEHGWGDTGVIACFAIAVLGIGAFLAIERAGAHPMFDLALFRKPTFAGGSIAAFGLSATLFALLLYVVLYLQDDLGYSALQTGLRLLVLSGGIMVTATVAGRASARVPIRWLIGPGLFLVGVGLLLMAGIQRTTSWTHLIPGFIVAGFGTGLVNPPLASTAIGVVEPARAGMASGINSTFRQVGIATGIAAFGTLFASRLTSELHAAAQHALAAAGQQSAWPALAPHVAQIGRLVDNGQGHLALSQLPAPLRGPIETAVRTSFARSLDEILIIGGVVALLAALASAALIRQRDFAQGSAAHEQAQAPAPA